jgi:hypothetical protein
MEEKDDNLLEEEEEASPTDPHEIKSDAFERIRIISLLASKYIAIIPPTLATWSLLASAGDGAAGSCDARIKATLAVWLVCVCLCESHPSNYLSH